jgi:hypothetical protein
MTGKAEQKSFDTPDETRTFELGTADVLQIGGAEIGRLTFQPGWRWSEHVRPIAGTELCEAPHFQYHDLTEMATHDSAADHHPPRHRRLEWLGQQRSDSGTAVFMQSSRYAMNLLWSMTAHQHRPLAQAPDLRQLGLDRC